jgi:hypothetical protein
MLFLPPHLPSLPRFQSSTQHWRLLGYSWAGVLAVAGSSLYRISHNWHLTRAVLQLQLWE